MRFDEDHDVEVIERANRNEVVGNEVEQVWKLASAPITRMRPGAVGRGRVVLTASWGSECRVVGRAAAFRLWGTGGTGCPRSQWGLICVQTSVIGWACKLLGGLGYGGE